VRLFSCSRRLNAAANQSVQQLQAVGARVVGAVLNDLIRRVPRYGAYYKYDYSTIEELIVRDFPTLFRCSHPYGCGDFTLYSIEALFSFVDPAWLDKLGAPSAAGPGVIGRTTRARENTFLPTRISNPAFAPTLEAPTSQ